MYFHLGKYCQQKKKQPIRKSNSCLDSEVLKLPYKVAAKLTPFLISNILHLISDS